MKVNYVEADLSDDAALMVANLFLTWGSEEGVMPDDRTPITEEEDAIFACVDDGSVENGIVGGAVFFNPESHPEMLFLDVLWVSPDYRRKGIGRALIQRVCAIAAERGLAKVEFGTLVTNSAMQGLGRALGFSDYALMMNCRLSAGGAA